MISDLQIPEISVEEFFAGDNMKIDIFKKKYLNSDTESVTDCFNRIVSEVSSVSIESDKDHWKHIWIDEFLNDMWRPGGSIIAGVNKKDRKISILNCTTIPLEGDSLEDIFKCRYESAKAAAYRQGLGVDFSQLRPSGAKINNSAEIAEGVVGWMKAIDNLGNEVGQAARKPALLFSIKIDHPDVLNVIKAKIDLKQIQNANISIQVTDDFMTAVANDDDWEMKFVVNGGSEVISQTTKATELFNFLCDTAYRCSEPGIQFIDLMKRFSIQESLGYKIHSSNACSEKPLPKYGGCLLMSLNMNKVPHVNDQNFKPYIEKITKSMVRFGDNVVQYEIEHPHKSPLPQQLELLKQTRELGMGVTNIHKWLYNQGFEYDTNEGISAIEEFYRWYAYYTFKASCELAIEREPCLGWSNAKSNNTIIETEYLTSMFDEFPDLKELYYKTGIRNAALLSQAPAGSVGMTFSDEVISSGIESIIAPYYWRRTRAVNRGRWDYYFVLPNFIKDLLLKSEMDEFDRKVIESISGSILDNEGVAGEEIIKIIKKYLNVKLLKGAHEIDPFKKIEMIGKVQKYVDAAISVTFNLTDDFPIEENRRLFMEAYKRKVKAISIHRPSNREAIFFFEFPIKKDDFKEKPVRPEDIRYVFAPERPNKLPCESYRVLKHHVIVGLMNDKPYEVFIIDTDKKIPESGFIERVRKQGGASKKYVLYDETDAIIIDNLTDSEVSNDEIKAITRLVSSNLRHGVAMDFVCEQLNKCGNSISSYPKMLGRVLKKYKFMNTKKDSDTICPNCNEILVKNAGCLECLSCGWGKCE